LSFTKIEIVELNKSQAKLLQQLNENKLVSLEFKELGEDANIFKLYGAVLIK
jgi:chaperonin cofactor prefoldin